MKKTNFLLAFLLTVGLIPFETIADESELAGHERWTERQVRGQMRQLQYHRRVETWARENNATMAEFIERYYRPILEGNRQGHDQNMQRAERLRDQAQEMRTRNLDDQARQYAQAAKLFFQCAQKNNEIIKAIAEDRDNKAMEKAFAELLELEREIFQITNRWPQRNWFMPDEMRVTEVRLRRQREQ